MNNVKKIFLLLCFFVVSLFLCAQEGIHFEDGDWKSILSKAKQENKLVFIDVYTSWCGPCKKMVKEVFPQKQVGELFNTSFVNYKIDAEKGDGISIAKQYNVKAYPTYLFVNAAGELVYRLTGFNEAEPFMAHAINAIKEKDDPRPLAVWNNEFEAGKRDKSFLEGYLSKRALLKLPSADIIEELMPMVTDADLISKEFRSSLLYSDVNVQFVPAGKFYHYVLSHYRQIDSLMGKSKGYSLRLLQLGIRNYFIKNIVAEKREELLPVIIKTSKELSGLLQEKDEIASSKRWAMDYYRLTKDTKRAFAAAADYVNNGILKLDLRSLLEADELDYKRFMEPYLSGEGDSLKKENWDMLKRINKNKRMINISYQLRDAAEAVYYSSDNKQELLKAAAWAQLAQQYFPHFSNTAVYAAILFKSGNKAKAIELMSYAANDSILQQNNDVKQLLNANVIDMKKAKAPEKIWKL